MADGFVLGSPPKRYYVALDGGCVPLCVVSPALAHIVASRYNSAAAEAISVIPWGKDKLEAANAADK